MVELTIFALGILLIDLMVPREWKWINAVGAFVGVVFAALCVWQIQRQLPRGAVGFYNSLLVDRFAIYFWYLFLAGAAIAILMSVHYLDVEDEHHGEYYSLLLLSVVGMMCMAAGYRHRAAFHRARTDGDFHLRAGWFFAPRPALERSGLEVSAARGIFVGHLRLRPLAVLRNFRQAPTWRSLRARSRRRIRTIRWW